MLEKEDVDDEQRITAIFGEVAAASVERLRLDGVRVDLEAMGYAVGGADLPAASVGAPHIRQRLWWVADAEGTAAGAGHDIRARQPDARRSSRVGDATIKRRREARGDSARPTERPAGADGGVEHAESDHQRRHPKSSGDGEGVALGRPGGASWDDYELVACSDGKSRRVESGTPPLAARVPGDLVRLRAYGNAVTIPLAAEFVRAYMEAMP